MKKQIPIGIGGGETGFALRASASHSGDKGDGGVNTNFVVMKKEPFPFDTAQITSKDNRTQAEPGMPASTLNGSGSMHVAVPEIVGTLNDGVHNGGGRTAKTPTLEESFLPDVAWAIQKRDAKGPDSSTKEGHLIPTRRGGFFNEHGAQTHRETTTFAQNTRDEVREIGGNIAGALPANPGMKQQTYLQTGMSVRRLTPRECERLQGFPDDFTLIKYRGKAAKDGPRYKVLGNSMAVTNIKWLLERMDLIDELAPLVL